MPLPPHLAEPGIVALRAGRLRLGLAPALGGSVVYFAEERPESLHHWFRPASADAVTSGTGHHAACFPLVPVSGRVADARLDWDGTCVALTRNVLFEPNHLHGEGWRMPWTVEEADEGAATLVLRGGRRTGRSATRRASATRSTRAGSRSTWP